MTYLIWVAAFGTAGVFFLWLRDARIFFRTGLPGFRRAAYYGVIYGALALAGLYVAYLTLEILGFGIILAALYLQGRLSREPIWTDEGMLFRFFGSVPVRKANKK